MQTFSLKVKEEIKGQWQRSEIVAKNFGRQDALEGGGISLAVAMACVQHQFRPR